MTFTTDCLVLCIDDSTTIKLFIFFDIKEKKFFIRGKNYDDEANSDTNSEITSEMDSNSKTNSFFLNKPFSFSSKTKKNLVEFIIYLISINSCTFTLYNYNNLSFSSKDISFEFLEKFQESVQIIECYH